MVLVNKEKETSSFLPPLFFWFRCHCQSLSILDGTESDIALESYCTRTGRYYAMMKIGPKAPCRNITLIDILFMQPLCPQSYCRISSLCIDDISVYNGVESVCLPALRHPKTEGVKRRARPAKKIQGERVTHHVAQNLPLTSKQKFRFSVAWPG